MQVAAAATPSATTKRDGGKLRSKVQPPSKRARVESSTSWFNLAGLLSRMTNHPATGGEGETSNSSSSSSSSSEVMEKGSSSSSEGGRHAGDSNGTVQAVSSQLSGFHLGGTPSRGFNALADSKHSSTNARSRSTQNEEEDGNHATPFRDRKGKASAQASSRRQPMFASRGSHDKHALRMQALREMPVPSTSAYRNDTRSALSTTTSVLTGVDLHSPTSPTGSSSLLTTTSTTSPPSSLYADADASVDDLYREPVFPLGHQRNYQSFSQTIVGVYPSWQQQHRFQPDILRSQMPSRHSFKRQDDLVRSFENARISLQSPRPPKPSLLRYRQAQRDDELASEKIEDLTRKRRKWPQRLPDDIQEIVRSTLRQRGVISQLPAAEVAGKDIVKLLPGEWLNDELINFYGVMVNMRSTACQQRRKEGLPAKPMDEDLLDVHVYSSFFYAKLVSSGYQGVKKWSKKFDTFQKDMIIMPVNLGNAHWVCAAINLRKKRFEYYDSMGKMNRPILDNLRSYLEAEHKEKKKTPLDTRAEGWTDYYDPKIPQQENGYDCGVFTSQFIECLSRKGGYFDFHQRNMPYLRQKMVHEIKCMELIPEEWI